MSRLAADRRQQVLGGGPADILEAHVDAGERRGAVMVDVALQRYYVRGLVSGALKG